MKYRGYQIREVVQTNDKLFGEAGTVIAKSIDMD